MSQTKYKLSAMFGEDSPVTTALLCSALCVDGVVAAGGDPHPDAGGPEAAQHRAGGQVRGPRPGLYCTVLYCAVLYCAVLCCAVLYCGPRPGRLLQLPERLLLPPVARLRLGRGLARPRAARPHQDQAAAQAPPAQAEVQVHLPARRGQGGEETAVGRAGAVALACIVVLSNIYLT